MAKRKYTVKGTNDFIVLAAIFFFLCIWAVKDAWFPSEGVLKKHPREVNAAFQVAGTVEAVHVKVGDTFGEKTLLATLRTDRVDEKYEEAKVEYTDAKKKHGMMSVALKNAKQNGASDEGIAEIAASVDSAKKVMNEAHIKLQDLKSFKDNAELLAEDKGTVLEIKTGTHALVEPGDTVIVIDPNDHFYTFNKSLAIFSFFAFWAFLAIHIFGR